MNSSTSTLSKHKCLNANGSSCSSNWSEGETRLNADRKVSSTENVSSAVFDKSDVDHKRIATHLMSDCEEERDEVLYRF